MPPDPFRRPPMVDIPAEQADTMWTRWTRRLTENDVWGEAKTFADVCELSAQFCEGKLDRTPGHLGPRMPETVVIAEELAHANRQGFLTECSQPGQDVVANGAQCLQRAAIEGYATDATLAQLRGLVAGTRLVLMVHEPLRKRDAWAYRAREAATVARALAQGITTGRVRDETFEKLGASPRYREHALVSKAVFPDGHVLEETHFGHRLTKDEAAEEFGGAAGDEIAAAHRVTIYDPEWGPSRLLYDRLGQPNWNQPEPPQPETTDKQRADLDVAVERYAAGVRWAEDRGLPQELAWLREEVTTAREQRDRFVNDNPPPSEENRAMPAHIPPGREHLWQRQAEADAEVARIESAAKTAQQHADDLAAALGAHDPIVEDADAAVVDLISAEYSRALSVADRVHQERTAGLSYWIDTNPLRPICSDCGGSGGPAGSDAHSSCRTCRGWGREDDGRPPIPVWSEVSQEWVNPATGQTVDLLADPDSAPRGRNIRDQAADRGDLATTLREDDRLEDAGMHADERRSCWTCQSWNDHAHDQVTGRRMTLNEWEGRPDGNESDDLDRAADNLPPAAEPFVPAQRTTTSAPPVATPPAPTTTCNGGSSMSSAGTIEGAKASIMASASTVQENLGGFQASRDALETAQSQLLYAAQGTSQADAPEAIAMLGQAKDLVEQAQQMALAAIQAAEGVANRL